MSRTAGQLMTLVKQICKMNIAELGENESIQNTYIMDFMSRALHELASLSCITRTSDVLSITSDGYVTFNIISSPIQDLYEPLRILDSQGRETPKRTTFSAPNGWYRESANTDIHVKGFNGTYVLHYKAYPAEITGTNQVPEFPESGYMALVYWTCALINESKGFFDEANHMYDLARQRLKIIVKANEDARGRGPGGSMPSVNDVSTYFS